jgi:hypothetical protein
MIATFSGFLPGVWVFSTSEDPLIKTDPNFKEKRRFF